MNKINLPQLNLVEIDRTTKASSLQSADNQLVEVIAEILETSGIIDMVKAVITRKDAQTSEWLDSTQAAAYLSISEGQLRNKTSNGDIPYYKWNRLNRYKRSELDTLLSSKKRGGARYGC